jgi:hypothetical protein
MGNALRWHESTELDSDPGAYAGVQRIEWDHRAVGEVFTWPSTNHRLNCVRLGDGGIEVFAAIPFSALFQQQLAAALPRPAVNERVPADAMPAAQSAQLVLLQDRAGLDAPIDLALQYDVQRSIRAR